MGRNEFDRRFGRFRDRRTVHRPHGLAWRLHGGDHLLALVSLVIALIGFKQIKGSGISFNLSCSEVIVVEVDPLESDLVLYNLLQEQLGSL